MSETYQITAPNGLILQVDKDTNKIHFLKNKEETGKYTEEYSKALLEAWQIMEEAKKNNTNPSTLTQHSKLIQHIKKNLKAFVISILKTL